MAGMRVKMCSKCHTLKPLIEQRTVCHECNLARKRAVAAAKLATPEGRAANRAKAAAFRASDAGREYMRGFIKQPEQRAKSNERARKRYVPNPRLVMSPDEKRAHVKAYRAKNRRDNYAAHLHREVGARAKRKGLPFDLPLAYFEAALAVGKCELSGLAFEHGEIGPFSISVDRIKPELGYVLGNVRAVLWCLNAALGDWGLEVFLPVARAIVDANPKTGV